MYTYMVENWDTGNHYGQYNLRTDDFMTVLARLGKKLHMTVDSSYYDDGMISKTNHFLRGDDGTKYRVYYLGRA